VKDVSPRRAKAIALALLALAAVVAIASALVAAARLRPLDPQAPMRVFDVRPGASLGSVARELERDGIIRDARALIALARWRELDGRLRAGEYDVSAAWTPAALLEQLTSGRVRTYAVSIPEGLRIADVAARIEAAGFGSAEAFAAVARDGAFARELGIEAGDLEGYLFPETYRFPRGVEPRVIARALVAQFEAVWAELAERAAASPLSRHEIVTLASIVEKETGDESERPLIAAVFLNRLKRGMRLETDPTVIFGIPDFDGNLRRVHLEDASNPYNTYRIAGLPPGPIASPGRAALEAVLAPADASFLYFVARGDGTHEFSVRYADHVRAVDRYQRRRRR